MSGLPPMPQNMMGPGINGDQNMHMSDQMIGNMHAVAPGSDMMASEGFTNPYGGMQMAGLTVGMPDGSMPDAAQFNGYPAGFNGDVAMIHADPSFAGRGGPARSMPRGGRGTPPARGAPATMAMRGRGRGLGFVAPETTQALPARPASPLPPNVPTGPRNRTTYKDKDREPQKQEVEGLDYGGGVAADASSASRKRPFAGDEDNGRSKRR